MITSEANTLKLPMYSNSAEAEKIPQAHRVSLFAHAATHIRRLQKAGKLPLPVALKGKQLSYWKNFVGLPELHQTVYLWVMEIANSYNIARNISEIQGADIANYIIRQYWHLKLAEIAYFVDQAKAGVYGQAFNGLDQATIIGWLDKHCADRDAELLNQHDKAKQGALAGADLANLLTEAEKKDPEIAGAIKAMTEGPKKNPVMLAESERRHAVSIYPFPIRQMVEKEQAKPQKSEAQLEFEREQAAMQRYYESKRPYGEA